MMQRRRPELDPAYHFNIPLLFSIYIHDCPSLSVLALKATVDLRLTNEKALSHDKRNYNSRIATVEVTGRAPLLATEVRKKVS
jgi:hypothetical protein